MSPPYLVLYKITYLGTRLASKNEELREVQRRIQGLLLYLATDKMSWRQLESSSSTVPNTDPQYINVWQ
jgi:uracil phosphoribosyltransferase